MRTLLLQTLKECRSWDDLQKSWSGLSKKQKGDLFEELVKHYLLLEPEYSSKIAKVWLLKEVPTHLADRLKLPPEDKGIDLVVETKKGEYWAVQCKYREESDKSVTWREISTFTGLAFGVCRGFSFGLIASSTERITRILRNQENVGFATLDVWQALKEEFFCRLKTSLLDRRDPLKPRQPRPHQGKAVADVVSAFEVKGVRRGKLIMPCGTGKSLTSFFISQKLRPRSVVIAVPSLALVGQTLKEWMRESIALGEEVEWICVCSDESAGKIDQDDITILAQDLGVPCYTDYCKIAEWLSKNQNSRTIVFTTYQSGDVLSKAAKKAGFSFDLGIMDEAHKTTGAKERLFSHLIHDKNIRIQRRLFMTATERRYRGEGDEILSMDDEEVYGRTLHRLSFKKALEYSDPKILSDYKLITLLVTTEEMQALIRNRNFVIPEGWDKSTDARNLASLIALRKAMKRFPIGHTVSFHSSIRKAKDFQHINAEFHKSFPEEASLESFHVSGELATGTRKRIIKDFANAPIGLVTNARCLTEGVDVPKIDAILFADPRKSKVDIVQAVGRALRPYEGKKYGYVIVPVVLDKDATFEEVLDSDSFREVLTTIRELGAEDERIIEYFRSLSQGERSGADHPLSEFSEEVLSSKINIKAFNKAVRLRVWSRLARLSWMPYEQAREYVRRLNLKSESEWRLALQKRQIPPDIPASAPRVYEKQWQGWPDWLGYTSKRIEEPKGFKEARKFARGLGLKNQIEWTAYIKRFRPEGIPAGPSIFYKGKGWSSWPDWLGYQPKKVLRPRGFKSARAFVRGLGLKNQKEWNLYCMGRHKKQGEKPDDIPTKPERVYKNSGWISLGDWLGTGYISTGARRYWSFSKARKYVRKMKIQSQNRWFVFTRSKKYKDLLQYNIPTAPHSIYKKNWKSWGDWLGTGTVATYNLKYWSFAKARTFVHSLKLNGTDQWFEYCKLHRNPPQIPSAAARVYKNKGWKSWSDFLGTKRAPRNSLRG